MAKLLTDYEHKPQNQPPMSEQAVASSQLSSIEIGICGAIAGMVSRSAIFDAV
jgi:hypothetical protein